MEGTAGGGVEEETLEEGSKGCRRSTGYWEKCSLHAGPLWGGGPNVTCRF